MEHIIRQLLAAGLLSGYQGNRPKTARGEESVPRSSFVMWYNLGYRDQSWAINNHRVPMIQSSSIFFSRYNVWNKVIEYRLPGYGAVTILHTCVDCESYISYLKGNPVTLQWCHNGYHGVSNHQPHHCLLNRLFRRRSKKISKPRLTSRCAGNSSVTGEFSVQMASKAENVSIWWRHHEPRNLSQRSYGVVLLNHCSRETPLI